MEERKITRSQLQLFHQYLIREEKSTATVEKYLRDARAFAVCAYKECYIFLAKSCWKLCNSHFKLVENRGQAIWLLFFAILAKSWQPIGNIRRERLLSCISYSF